MLQCWAKMPTDRPTFEALKDFLAETIPIVVRAREGLEEEGRMRIEPGDALVVIDGRSENFWWKGQNQRTFDVGLFPRKIVEDSQGKKIKDISKPLKNSFIHTGHGSHNGRSWGKAEAIDDLYLRSPMHPPDLTGIGNGNQDERKLPGRSSMKIKNNPIVPESIKQTHQFNYGRFEDERRKEQEHETYNTIRPHRPAPGWKGDRVQTYKSLPDLQKVYEDQDTNLHSREDSLIDLSPAETMSRVYENMGPENILGAHSVTSLIDEDIPSTNPNRNVYQNQNFQNPPLDRFNDSNASFSSLPDGETYHVPPDEDDPFDTSSVILSSTVKVSRYQDESQTSIGFSYTNSEYRNSRYHQNQGYPHLSVSGSADESETKPSIISQLLASTSQAGDTPPAISITPTLQLSSTPEPGRSNNTFNPVLEDSSRHRRAVSTTAEADLFFPPLTSPFSPPAFNPYDIVLGSNEAIAGLDSPAAFQSSDKPKRQTQLNSSEAFSWLNDKIGDMKVSQRTDRNVFQFPSVSEMQAQHEDMYATVKKMPSLVNGSSLKLEDKYSQEDTDMTQREQTQPFQSQVDLVYNSFQDKSEEGTRSNQGTSSYQVTSSNQVFVNNISNISNTDSWKQNFESGSDRSSSYEVEKSDWKDSSSSELGYQTSQTMQTQEQLRNQALTSQNQKIFNYQMEQQQQLKIQQQQSFQQQQMQQQQLHQQQQQIQQQQLHQQQLNQQMKQQNLERQRQQQRVQQEQEIQHQRNLYQQQQNLQQQIQQQTQQLEREKEMERKNLEKIQQHRVEKERKKSEDEKRRRDEYEQRQRESDLRSRLEATREDVFHFPQFSTLSTTGAPKETYAVDKNFIKDLEKNLGKNESK